MSLFGRIDFKRVQWGRTLALNLLRAFAAGLVWAIVMLFTGGGASSPSWWTMPFIIPFAYLFALPMYVVAVKIFTAFAGDGIGQLSVGIVTFLFALGIAVGDPLVYILHKKKPELVPTETFKLFNLVLVLFVLDPARATAVGA